MAVTVSPIVKRTKSLNAISDPQRRTFWVRLYTVIFSLLGMIIILHAGNNLPADKTGFFLYIGLGVITELLSVELFANMRGSRVSAAAIISIAGILTFGPLPGALINSVCGLASSFVDLFNSKNIHSSNRASFWRRTFFNIGMLTVSTYVAGVTYTALGGAIRDPLHIENALPLLMAVLASEGSNILILIGVVHLQTGQPIQVIWEKNVRWGVPISILGGILGSLTIAVAHAEFGMIGLTLFFLPVLAIGYSFRLYMNNMRVHVNKLEQANAKMDEINISLLETLGAVIDAYDLYTYGHSAQVATYAADLTDRMGITGEEKSNIVRAALVHDIGKVGVMESIISKPGRLTDEERRIMERHPVISADILRQMKGLQDLFPLVRHHHERWDGRGYPAGLAGEEIPLGARVIAVADAVDAMCSSRPYRKAIKIDDVKIEIQLNSGIQFDPRIVEAFFQLAAEKDNSYFKDSASVIDENIVSNNALFKPEGLRYLKRSMLLKESEILER